MAASNPPANIPSYVQQAVNGYAQKQNVSVATYEAGVTTAVAGGQSLGDATWAALRAA